MLLLKVLRQVVLAVQPIVRQVEGHMKAWTKPAQPTTTFSFPIKVSRMFIQEDYGLSKQEGTKSQSSASFTHHPILIPDVKLPALPNFVRCISRLDIEEESQ
jgi:hypothetical protein